MPKASNKKNKPYKPSSCPKCNNERKFYYCSGNRDVGDCDWRFRVAYHPFHDKGEAFHVICQACSFKEVLFEVIKNETAKYS